MKSLRDMTLTTKFLFGIGIIVVFFWCIFNVIIYLNLKDNSIRQTYEKTDVLFAHIQATVSYIRKQLRPKLFHILQTDQIVPEAMSVSFMNKEIMSEFRKYFPDFKYRRVAINPTNSKNAPDEIEISYINRFRSGDKKDIRGIVKRSGVQYFIHARPIVVEMECLACHGDPQKAPVSLVSLYGTDGGFNWPLGEVIGVESVTIPLGDTFLQIKELVLSIFLMGLIGVVFLFVSVNYYINIVAVRPIRSVSRFFKSVVDGKEGLDTRVSVKSRDEIGELADSFNQMMEYLKDSQDRLRHSETKYRRIFEGSKDAILLAGCDGVIQDINPAGLELFGCKDKNKLIQNIRFSELFLKENEYDDFLGGMDMAGYVKDYETKLSGVDGRVVDVLITANFRRDEDGGNICGYEVLIKDITEWKRVQEQMKEADRLASVGQLAAGLAHEINNPLGIIMGYTGILLKEVDGNNPVRADLEVINRNVEACKKIVEDLLKFSRKTETKLESININNLIEEILDMFSYKFEEGQVELIKEYQPDMPVVELDVEKMRQVLMNIVMNALQAIDGHGRIEFRTRYDKIRRRVSVSVKDNGRGIDEKLKGRIFEPFFTTKAPGEGTGLGLSVSYGIVKEHGGDILVDSRIGGGSIFTVELPLKLSDMRSRG